MCLFSPVLNLSLSGGSPDDAYLSADDEPAEGPRFQRLIEDAAASTGTISDIPHSKMSEKTPKTPVPRDVSV